MTSDPAALALDALVERMEALLVPLQARGDPRRYFHTTYLRTTKAVRAEFAAGGFLDTAWVALWDVAFAGLYLDALDAGQRGERPPGPWTVAFATADKQATALPPLRHVLLGMNAHINYDLAQALLAVISDAEFDDAALLERRGADHRRIDQVLAALVDADCRRLGAANRLATKRFLKEARAKVWANTHVLARARRQGEAAYRARLAELERLATARVADLTRPGQVLLELAARGFGVRLPPDPKP
jgi:Family of unknown function (DUF5995)